MDRLKALSQPKPQVEEEPQVQLVVKKKSAAVKPPMIPGQQLAIKKNKKNKKQ
jgi:hypothetical protein